MKKSLAKIIFPIFLAVSAASAQPGTGWMDTQEVDSTPVNTETVRIEKSDTRTANTDSSETGKAKKIVTVSGITEYRLDNGMKVLLFPDSSSAKTTVNLTFLVGSRHEGYGETGMAHLLEHLLFKGSKNHTNITKELSDHGASANGTTWYDRTNYYETFPASPENLEWALSMESDRMVNSFVAQKDLDSEMTVVRNEFERGENSPSGILNERIFSTAYLWHNYGKSTIGARADIENVPIDRLQAFYQKYYQPDNAILIVAGRFDESKALASIEKKFGTIPRPTRKLFGTYTAEPTQDGERTVELKRTGDSKVVAAAYHIPSGASPEFAAVDVLGQLLLDTPSGRLYKKLVATKIATGVSGGAYQLHDPSLLFFEASARKDADLDNIQAILLETIHGLKVNPPTQAEVDRAKQILLKSTEKVERNTKGLALQLSEWASMGDWRLFFLYKQRLKNVTTADVVKAADTYLKTSNRTVGRFLPVDVPSRSEIAATSQKELEQALKDLKVEKTVSQGEVFNATPSKIKSRTKYSKLSNGINVAMLDKKNRGETVNIDITFRFANLDAVQGKGDIAGFAGGLLMRGTQSKTREQIKDLLVRLESSGSVSGGYDNVSASFSTTRKNLPKLLPLIAEIMKSPSFPAKEFDTGREQYLAQLEEAAGKTNVRASLALRQALSPYPKGDPRAVLSLAEDAIATKAVTLQQIKDFHKDFYEAKRGEIAVVGDFSPAEITPLLEKHFANWSNPKSPPYQRIQARVKTDLAGGDEQIHIADKANATYYAGKSLAISDTSPDYAALRLANYILGGGFLNSRLATRVRQKEGLSYSIGSNVSANALDTVGSFSIYAIAAPENIPKVKKAIVEELERAIKDGFTDEEVAAAKKGYLESLKLARNKDGNLAGLLGSYMHIQRDVEYLNGWDAKIRALTPAELQQAITKHLQPSSLYVVTAGTLKK